MRVQTKRNLSMLAVALVASLAVPLLAQADPDEPGPLTIDSEADLWGAYKSVTLDVTVHRKPGNKPVTVGVLADYDRHPDSGGLVNHLYVTIQGRSTGVYNDLWRDDAPPIFQLLDRACPKLLNAC